MEKKYQHLFFDLDRTLWDFDRSAYQTFCDLFEKHGLRKKNIQDVDVFFKTYNQVNELLWDQYRAGTLSKEILRDLRFQQTLMKFGIDDAQLAERLSEDYLYYSPRNVHLFPQAVEVLEILQKEYQLHMITNGFEEVQHIKLSTSGLGQYFQTIVTSEEAGVKKPDPKIFHYALAKAGADAVKSLMIGDDLEVDVLGAKAVGMDQVFFNPEQISHQNQPKPTFEITALAELISILKA